MTLLSPTQGLTELVKNSYDAAANPVLIRFHGSLNDSASKFPDRHVSTDPHAMLMPTAELDDLSGVPRYLQIAQAVEAQIREGLWLPGNPMPSRNRLAERYGVARETAARAYHWLAVRGFLVRVAGVGIVVTPANRWPAASG